MHRDASSTAPFRPTSSSSAPAPAACFRSSSSACWASTRTSSIRSSTRAVSAASCIPEKPIYDIPALPVCGAQELVDRLLQQAKPFNAQFHLGEEVAELKVLEDHTFLLRTSQDTRFHARTVIIAGGLGSFQPRRLGVEGAEAFEGRHVHYKVKSAAEFTGKRLVIFGGGDSALDWTLEFAGKARSVTLVHRRPEFRAAPASVAKMRDLVAHGSMHYVEAIAHSVMMRGQMRFVACE